MRTFIIFIYKAGKLHSQYIVNKDSAKEAREDARKALKWFNANKYEIFEA